MVRKRGIIVVAISLVIFGIAIYWGYVYMKSNLEKIVISSIRDYAKLNINFKNITIGLNEEITLNKFKLYDKTTNEELITAEKFIVKYDMLRLLIGDRRVNEFRVFKGSLNLKIYDKFKNINIISNFTDPNIKEYSTPIIEKITIQKSVLFYNDYSFKKPIVRELSNVEGKIEFNDKSRSMNLSAKGNIGKEIYGIAIRTSMEESNFEIGLDFKNIEINQEVMQYGYQNKDIAYKKGLLDLNLKVDHKMNLQGQAKIKNGVLHYKEVSRDIDKITGLVSFEGRTKIKVFASGFIDKEKADFKLEVKDYHDPKKTTVKINISSDNINYETLKYYENIRKNTQLFQVAGILKRAEVELIISPDLKLDLKGSVEAKEILFFKETFNNIKGEFSFDAKISHEKGLDETYKNIWTVKNVTGKFGTADITLSGTAESSKKYKLFLDANGIDIKRYVKEFEAKTKTSVEGKVNFTGTIEDEKVEGDYNIKVKTPNLDLSEGKGKLTYYFLKGMSNGDFNVENSVKGDFIYDVKNYDMILGLSIREPQKFRYLNFEGNIFGNLSIDANFKKNDIRDIRTTLTALGISLPKNQKQEVFLDKMKIDKIHTQMSIKGNKLNFDKSEIILNKNSVKLNGEVNIETLKYNIKIDDARINVSDMFNEEVVKKSFNNLDKVNLNSVINVKAILNGEKSNITCSADLYSTDGQVDIELKKIKPVKVKYGGIKTSIDFSMQGQKISVAGRSSIQNIGVNQNELKEITARFSYDTDDINKIGTINLYEIKNNLFSANGEYSLSENRVVLNYLLKNIEFDKYKIFQELGIEGYLKEARGNISGSFSNPMINARIGEIQLKYGNIQIYTSGELLLIDKVLNLKEFKVDDNILNGQIDIEKMKLDMKVNIYEPNFRKYFDSKLNKINILKDISGRIIGEINIWGDIDSPKATASTTIDQIYYNDIKVPDIFVKSTFNKKTLNISKLMCMGVEAEGMIDIDKKDFELKSKENEIDLKKIESFTGGTKLNGKVITAFNVIGNFGKFIANYNFSVKSNKININEFELKKLSGKIDGNLHDINIKMIEGFYEDYMIKINGTAKIEKIRDFSSWDLNIDAEKFGLKILQPFIKGYINSLSGTGSIKATIKNGNLAGKILLENTAFKLNNFDANFSNISVDAKLQKDRVIFNEIRGHLNGGTFIADGDYKLSGQNPEWNGNLTFNNVVYEYGKIYAKVNGVINADEKLAEGKVIIEEGRITGIPGMTEEKKVEKESENISNISKISTSKKKKNFFEDYTAKIGIEVNKKCELRLENISMIQDIQATIEGNGTVSYTNGKINLTGTLSTEKGALTANNNIFKIDSAVLVFDDPTQYFPKFNPSISIRAETSIASEYVYVNIAGYLDSLQVNFTSSSNLGPLEISRLLLLHTRNNVPIDSLQQELFQSQIERQILDPLLEKLAKQWGLQKLVLNTKNLFNTTKGQDILLGSSAEAAMYLYEKSVYLDLGLKYSDTIPGAFDSYNIGLKYDITDSSKNGLDYIFDSFNLKLDTKLIENISLNLSWRDNSVAQKEVNSGNWNKVLYGLELKSKF